MGTCLVFSAVGPLYAAKISWDIVSGDSQVTGGSGVWDTTTPNWTLNNGVANITWPATGLDNDAVFSGTGGTVTIAPEGITANDLTVQKDYRFVGGPLTLNGGLSGNLIYTPTICTVDLWVDIQATGGDTNLSPYGIYTIKGSYDGSGRQLTVSGKASLELLEGSIQAQRFVIGSGGGELISRFTLTAGTVAVDSTAATNSYLGVGTFGDAIVDFNGGSVVVGNGSQGMFIADGVETNAVVNIGGSDVRIESGGLNIGSGSDGLQVSEKLSGILNLNSGSLTFDSSGAIRLSNAATQKGVLNLNGGIFNLNGVTIGRGPVGGGTAQVSFSGGKIHLTANNASIFGAGIHPVIDAGGATIDTGGFNGTISTNLLAGTVSGGLTKEGAGTLSLTGANTYSGDTVVAGGTLSVSQAFLADDSSVTIVAGATLDLQTGDTDTIGTLTIGGMVAAGGTWGPTGSGADHESPAITGTGLLNVPGAGGPTPFEIFVSGYGLSGNDALPAADPDGDGSSNLLEFALNGDPTSGTSNGTAAGAIRDFGPPTGKAFTLVIAARRGASFVAGPNGTQTATADDVQYRIEGSANLASFVSAVSFVSSSDTFMGNPSLAGSDWEYFTFKLDASEGLGGKGFLRAVINPAD